MKRDKEQKDSIPERQGEVHLEKKIVFRVSTTEEEIVVMIERVIIRIPRLVNTSRKMNVKWERIVHLFTRKRKINLPVPNEKEGQNN